MSMFEVEVGGKVIARAVEWRYALVGAIKELKSDDASISELLSRYTLVNDYALIDVLVDITGGKHVIVNICTKVDAPVTIRQHILD